MSPDLRDQLDRRFHLPCQFFLNACDNVVELLQQSCLIRLGRQS
jgi:hypothetical protein